MFHFIGEKNADKERLAQVHVATVFTCHQDAHPQKRQWGKRCHSGYGDWTIFGWLALFGDWPPRLEDRTCKSVSGGAATTVKVHGLLGGCGQVTLTVTMR